MHKIVLCLTFLYVWLIRRAQTFAEKIMTCLVVVLTFYTPVGKVPRRTPIKFIKDPGILATSASVGPARLALLNKKLRTKILSKITEPGNHSWQLNRYQKAENSSKAPIDRASPPAGIQGHRNCEDSYCNPSKEVVADV